MDQPHNFAGFLCHSVETISKRTCLVCFGEASVPQSWAVAGVGSHHRVSAKGWEGITSRVLITGLYSSGAACAGTHGGFAN